MLRGMILSFFTVVASVCQAQSWDYSPDSDHHKSVVRIESDLGPIGSGCVVWRSVNQAGQEGSGGYIGYVLTARHVVEDGGLFVIKYHSGKKSNKCSVYIHHPRSEKDQHRYDVSILKVWVPDDVVPLEIYGEDLSPEQMVEVCGYSGGVDVLRHWNVPVGGLTYDGEDGNLMLAGWVLPGDSGGPFLVDGRVAGLTSGGYGWLKDRRFDTGKGTRKITFPIVGPATSTIREVFKAFVAKDSEPLPAFPPVIQNQMCPDGLCPKIQ